MKNNSYKFSIVLASSFTFLSLPLKFSKSYLCANPLCTVFCTVTCLVSTPMTMPDILSLVVPESWDLKLRQPEFILTAGIVKLRSTPKILDLYQSVCSQWESIRRSLTYSSNKIQSNKKSNNMRKFSKARR